MDALLYILPIVAIVIIVLLLVNNFKKSKDSSTSIEEDVPEELHSEKICYPRNVVMCVENVFKIAGRGTVVCGEIGIPISVGDQICVVDEAGNTIKADIICKGIERLHKLVNEAEPGETVGLLLDIKSDTIKKGMLLKR